MKRVILISSMLAASIMFSNVATAATTYDHYTVKKNDTLWIISKKFNVSLKSLLTVNPKVNPRNLMIGSSINLPLEHKQNWEFKADAIIQTGMTQLGVPYVFGGAQPNKAFDCSGFIQYIFNKNGYDLPHSSTMQSQLGTAVSKDELRKGDLIFLSGTYQKGVSHVAVYLGDNKVLQAGTKGGIRCVKISNFFGDPYYDAHYWGARRIIKN